MGFKKFLIIFLALNAFACGATKKTSPSGSANLPSRGGDNNNDGTTTTVNFYSQCNTFENSQYNGVLTTYLDPFSNQYNYEWIRLKFKSAPIALKQSDDFYIQFFKWNEEVEEKPYTHSKAVDMYFQYNSDGRLLRSSTINFVSKAVIEEMISNNVLIDTTIDNFFSKVTVILIGLELTYDALMINTYDSSVGTTPTSSLSALLPAFAADPNLYEETHTSNLSQLHPFWEIRQNGWTENQFHQESLALCN